MCFYVVKRSSITLSRYWVTSNDFSRSNFIEILQRLGKGLIHQKLSQTSLPNFAYRLAFLFVLCHGAVGWSVCRNILAESSILINQVLLVQMELKFSYKVAYI